MLWGHLRGELRELRYLSTHTRGKLNILKGVYLGGAKLLQVLRPGVEDLLLGLGNGAVFPAHGGHLSLLAGRSEAVEVLPQPLMVVLVCVLHFVHELAPVFALFGGDQPVDRAALVGVLLPDGRLGIRVGCCGSEVSLIGFATLRDRCLDLLVPPATAEFAADGGGSDGGLASLFYPLNELLNSCAYTGGLCA